ncbi:hypothetical protein, variant 1 [Capsaspora owczarzaki ATCC 30864]|uniref:Uncharacterized protein n=3 Tax=Capsaspora owczarzaki (strain ATCC 30864) TaxID=595528 RepID=A0A0D2X560_CAPO3|nr:hypothetical protein, variant 1 [Capsaspora owczarzaki ATCC 30864]
MARDVVSFIRKRQAIESEYAKALSKLCVQMKDTVPADKRVALQGGEETDLFGSVLGTWYSVLEEAHQAAMVQEHLAAELGHRAADPLQARLKDLETQRKQLVQDGQRDSKELQESYTALKKVKSVYDGLRKESDEIVAKHEESKNNHMSKEKDVSKLKGKADAALEKANTALKQFNQKESECKKQQEVFFQHRMPDILALCQHVEEERCRAVRDTFVTMKDVIEDRFQRLATLSERFARAVSSIDIHVDMEEFISNTAGDRSVSVMSLLYPSKKGRLFVHKRGEAADRWRQQFLVLMNDQQLLYLFDSEDSTKPRSIVSISSGDRTVRPVDESLFGRPNCFQIISNDDTLYFQAEDDNERREWLNKLLNISIGQKFTRRELVSRHVTSLHLRVIEAKKLSKSGDLYCLVRLDSELQARTQTRKDTNAPFWSEEFFFDEVPASVGNLEIVIMNSKRDLGSAFGFNPKDTEVGVVSVPISSLSSDSVFEDWINVFTEASSIGFEASLRARIKFSDQLIKPLASYQPMLDLLDEPTFITSLSTVIPAADRENLARTLIQIAHGSDRVQQFIVRLIKDEIASTDDPNIIFRGNSLATKTIDQFMKLVGMKYLHNTLSSVIKSIYDSKTAAEVDPTRVSNPNDLKQNWRRLLVFMNHTWDAILHSLDSCPMALRAVFRAITTFTNNKFGADSVSQYTAVSGFFFLRFMCPAILNPKLFDMMPTHPEEHTARTLTLIAKTLQNLGNLVEFGAKEPFMVDMNEFIAANLDKMKQCITMISLVPSGVEPKADLGSVDLARHAAVLHHFLEGNFAAVVSTSPLSEDPDVARKLKMALETLSSAADSSISLNELETKVTAIALYDYIAQREDELSFSEGDTIILISTEIEDAEGWCIAQHNGNTGLVPLTYVWIDDSTSSADGANPAQPNSDTHQYDPVAVEAASVADPIYESIDSRAPSKPAPRAVSSSAETSGDSGPSQADKERAERMRQVQLKAYAESHTAPPLPPLSKSMAPTATTATTTTTAATTTTAEGGSITLASVAALLESDTASQRDRSNSGGKPAFPPPARGVTTTQFRPKLGSVSVNNARPAQTTVKAPLDPAAVYALPQKSANTPTSAASLEIQRERERSERADQERAELEAEGLAGVTGNGRTLLVKPKAAARSSVSNASSTTSSSPTASSSSPSGASPSPAFAPPIPNVPKPNLAASSQAGPAASSLSRQTSLPVESTPPTTVNQRRSVFGAAANDSNSTAAPPSIAGLKKPTLGNASGPTPPSQLPAKPSNLVGSSTTSASSTTAASTAKPPALVAKPAALVNKAPSGPPDKLPPKPAAVADKSQPAPGDESEKPAWFKDFQKKAGN